MAVGSIRPTESADVAPQAAAPARPAEGASFAEALRRHLDRPRAEVEDVRSTVASLRGGAFLRAPAQSSPTITSGEAPVGIPAWVGAELAARATGDATDPYGWRAMSREVADSVIGAGYGLLFERQMQQESGFDPDVVYGLRTSSAGAEGIAQLMPQYYAGVDRTDPGAALVAGAKTMKHYLSVWDGDVRRALASYNAGLGRVRSLVEQLGDRWEEGLPAETKQYLASIAGSSPLRFDAPSPGTYAVFGGRGPGGVLSSPLESLGGWTRAANGIDLVGSGGGLVRAPADGIVQSLTGVDGSATVVLDHGNGWQTSLAGLAGIQVSPGALVSRSDVVGVPGSAGAIQFGVRLDGRPLDPTRYLVGL